MTPIATPIVPPIALTQLLYEATEVELSLVVAIVSRRPLTDVLFWTGELHCSGFGGRLWRLFWRIYYDFYAIAHPRLALQLHAWHMEYDDDPGLAPIAQAACNLRARLPRTEVFESRLYSNQCGKVIPRQFTSLTDLWSHGSLIQIGAFLRDTDYGWDMLASSLVRSHPRQQLPLCLDNAAIDQMHAILAAVASSRLPTSEVSSNLLLVDVPETSIEAMESIGSFDETTDYYYLSDRRDLATDKRLGCFNLPRFGLDNPLTEHLWFHWEFYAYNCPLWRHRFAKHGAQANSTSMTLSFPDEDREEAFFQEWNVLPDEQPKSVQAKASGQIVDVRYSRWFRETFQKSSCLDLAKQVSYNCDL
jgi:hypothetical protein